MANGSIVPGGKPKKPKSWLQKEGSKLGKDAKNVGNSIGKAFSMKGKAKKKGAPAPSAAAIKAQKKSKIGGMKPVTMKGFGNG